MATTYIVLRRTGPKAGGEWKVIGQKETNGPDQAIRALALSEPGAYVAVPTRSWHEVEGIPEVIERFKLTGVDKPVAHPGQETIDGQLAEAEAPAA